MIQQKTSKTQIDMNAIRDKNICNGFGCSKYAEQKVKVNCGKFGIISFDLCMTCLIPFRKMEKVK